MKSSIQGPSFQYCVKSWMHACFGEEISKDKIERCHRFLEESLELVQSLGITKIDVLKLVDYTFDRPIGEPSQEVGGVMITLAALCSASGIYMQKSGNDELKRIWTKIDAIRQKQATKPKHSPLPQ